MDPPTYQSHSDQFWRSREKVHDKVRIVSTDVSDISGLSPISVNLNCDIGDKIIPLETEFNNMVVEKEKAQSDIKRLGLIEQ